MNVWIAAATCLLFALPPLGWVVWRQAPVDGLAAVQLGSAVTVAVLLLLCEGVSRPEFADLALALAVLSFAGGLVYARLLERWI